LCPDPENFTAFFASFFKFIFFLCINFMFSLDISFPGPGPDPHQIEKQDPDTHHNQKLDSKFRTFGGSKWTADVRNGAVVGLYASGRKLTSPS
jgi:hypothetical protein